MSAYDVVRFGNFELLTDDEGGRGRVVVLALADGKAWTYCWPAKGRGPPEQSLVRWLRDCDIGYVAGKFGCDRWFDAHATSERAQEAVDQLLAGRGRDAAGDGELRDLRDWVFRTEAEWSDWLTVAKPFLRDAWEFTTYGVDPVFRDAFAALWAREAA